MVYSKELHEFIWSKHKTNTDPTIYNISFHTVSEYKDNVHKVKIIENLIHSCELGQ